VSTDIVGIVISTREAVSDLKISIGDSDSPLTNAECSVGVQIEANATSAQVRRGTILETSFTAPCHLLVKVAAPRPCFASGWLESYKCTAHLVHARLMLNVPLHGQVCNGKGRYLTLSRLSGASISLCGVEVFPVAANAAISKPATVSGGSNAYLATDGADGVICSFRHPARCRRPVQISFGSLYGQLTSATNSAPPACAERDVEARVQHLTLAAPRRRVSQSVDTSTLSSLC